MSVGGPGFCVWETVCLGELLVWFSALPVREFSSRRHCEFVLVGGFTDFVT